MTVANQKLIKIHKGNLQKEPFLSLSVETLANAYRELQNAYTFYLYIILCCNANNFTVEFSPQNILNQFGMPLSTTQDQIKKLIAKGFLVQKHENSNVYDFYADPNERPVIPKATPQNTSFNF